MATKKRKVSICSDDGSSIGVDSLRDSLDASTSRPEALQSVSRDDPLYNMTKAKRGYAIIFKMENYVDPKRKRRGASHDTKKCKEAFESLRFEVIVFADLTKLEILDELEKLRINKQLDKCDCLVVLYMGHGRKDEKTGKEYILMSDGKEILTSELWNPFSADKCRALAGQPKLYFIQACRGPNKDSGITMKKKKWSGWDADNVSEHDDYVIPLHSDMLMMWASYPEMPAKNNFGRTYGINGSIFIHYLCQVLLRYSGSEDLSSMLLTVTRKVGILYESKTGDKQLPHVSSTLMRKVVFHDRPKKLYEWISAEDKAEKLMELISTNE